MNYKLLFTLCSILLFSACSPTPIETRSAVVALKMNGIRVNDTAFIHNFGTYLQMEVYKAGVLVLTLRTGKEICLDDRCMSHRAFTDRYFGEAYPSDILLTILKRERVTLDEVQEQEISGGWSQSLVNEQFDISYRVTEKTLIFRDTKRAILIMIKEL